MLAFSRSSVRRASVTWSVIMNSVMPTTLEGGDRGANRKGLRQQLQQRAEIFVGRTVALGQLQSLPRRFEQR